MGLQVYDGWDERWIEGCSRGKVLSLHVLLSLEKKHRVEGSINRHLEPCRTIRHSYSAYALMESSLPKPQIQHSSNTTDLFDVILACGFVRGFEEACGIFAKPLGQLVKFFAETVDGLLVHVCLGDEFGEGD